MIVKRKCNTVSNINIGDNENFDYINNNNNNRTDNDKKRMIRKLIASAMFSGNLLSPLNVLNWISSKYCKIVAHPNIVYVPNWIRKEKLLISLIMPKETFYRSWKEETWMK